MITRAACAESHRVVRFRVTRPSEVWFPTLLDLLASGGYIVVPDQDSRSLVALSGRAYDFDRELFTLLEDWKGLNPAAGLEILSEPSPLWA